MGNLKQHTATEGGAISGARGRAPHARRSRRPRAPLGRPRAPTAVRPAPPARGARAAHSTPVRRAGALRRPGHGKPVCPAAPPRSREPRAASRRAFGTGSTWGRTVATASGAVPSAPNAQSTPVRRADRRRWTRAPKLSCFPAPPALGVETSRRAACAVALGEERANDLNRGSVLHFI